MVPSYGSSTLCCLRFCHSRRSCSVGKHGCGWVSPRRKPNTLAHCSKVEPSVWRRRPNMSSPHFTSPSIRGPLPSINTNAVTNINLSPRTCLTSSSALEDNTPTHPHLWSVFMRSVRQQNQGFAGYLMESVSQSVILSEETGSVCRPQLFTFPSDRQMFVCI